MKASTRFAVEADEPRVQAVYTPTTSSRPWGWLLALLVWLALGAVGCTSPFATAEPAVPTPAPTLTPAPDPLKTPDTGQTSLVFWEPYALDRPEGILLGEMIRDFEAENEDIAFEIVAKGGYGGIHGAMLDQLPDGELPDLAVAFPAMIAQYAAAGIIIPLDAYLSHPELGFTDADWTDVISGVLEAGRFPGFDGQTLAFPFAQNAIGMWVNEDLLQRAGWSHPPATWLEFEQACFDVQAATGLPCYSFVESATTFTAWLYSRGGRQLDESTWRATFGQPAGVESLALLRRLQDTGLAWRPEQPYGDYVAFANGQTAFTFSSTGNSVLYAEAYDGAVRSGTAPFRYRQVMIPQADPQNPATALFGASFFVVQSDPVRQEAAWRFIRWFTEAPQIARWAVSAQALPVRLSALGLMTDTLEAYPSLRLQVEDILPYALPEPAVVEQLELRELLHAAILSVTHGYEEPQTALDQAARKANTLLLGGP